MQILIRVQYVHGGMIILDTYPIILVYMYVLVCRYDELQ